MASISKEKLIETYGSPTHLTNGLILRLSKNTATMPSFTAASWLLTMMDKTPYESKDVKILTAKVLRTAQKAKQLRGSKLESFKEEEFCMPLSLMSINLTVTEPDAPAASINDVYPTLPSSPMLANEAPVPTSPLVVMTPASFTAATTSISAVSTTAASLSRPKPQSTPTKKMNTAAHTIAKREKHLSALGNKLKKIQDHISKEIERKAHYRIKNVKRREERSHYITTNLNSKIRDLNRTVRRLEAENRNLRTKNDRTEKEVRKLKRKAGKKLISKKPKVNKAKGKSSVQSNEEKVRYDSTYEDMKDSKLEMVTKAPDGFTSQTRFCVMELAGLEVATAKIGPVMETVSELCGVKLSNIPSRSACQMIIDEGQVLAQAFLREKVLKRSQRFGIHKDGTTRKKKKILDTSCTTDTGEGYFLGWSTVVSETGEAIAQETKTKLNEISESASEVKDGIDVDILKKIEFYMNDRAANEKKSNRLLDEWREELVKQHGEEVPAVQHLYCAAHVLLGFHTYVLTAIKDVSIAGINDNEYKNPIMIMLRDASDLFGPVGDYRGVKNEWQALTLREEIKSWIGAYKDNRFNGLFEVAAQVFHHHRKFFDLLQSHEQKNTKQQRFFNYLSNPDFILLLHCLGLFFHEEFRSIILQLKNVLENCISNPEEFFKVESFSFLSKFKASSAGTKASMATEIESAKMGELIKALSKGLLTALNVQLKDIIEKPPAISSTAPLTNLICERNFGFLDAGLRRRPHSSVHHLSSLLLLKQTRKRLRGWFEELGKKERERLMKRARIEGKELRRKHQERDKQAIVDSLKLKQKPVSHQEPQEMLKEGQMIAVACQDTWYPALVHKDSHAGQDVTVNFAELAKNTGDFKWPTGKDMHTVSRKSIVSTNVEYTPKAGGRFWCVTNAKNIQKLFSKFS